MANDVAELREHLFSALKGLKDKTIDVEQAKAICAVSQQVIDLAKVEVDYIKATGADLTDGFINHGKPALPPGVTQHRLRG